MSRPFAVLLLRTLAPEAESEGLAMLVSFEIKGLVKYVNRASRACG